MGHTEQTGEEIIYKLLKNILRGGREEERGGGRGEGGERRRGEVVKSILSSAGVRSAYFSGEHSREVDLRDHLLVHEGRSPGVIHVLLLEEMPHPRAILCL